MVIDKLTFALVVAAGLTQAQSLPITILQDLNLLPDLFRWTLPLTGSLPLAPNSTYNPTGWGAGHEPAWMCNDAAGNQYLVNQYGKIDKITPPVNVGFVVDVFQMTPYGFI